MVLRIRADSPSRRSVVLNNRHFVRRILLVLLTLFGVTSVAQETGDEAELQTDSELLPEIIVTAAKRGAESAQELPISIAAMNQELLEAMGVENFADFSTSVAGLDFVDNGPGDKRYLIRGISGAGEAQVGLYYGNIPVTGLGGSASEFGGSQVDPDLFDMERIEVLRGPQGTLYGASSMSGVVRIIPNQPNVNQFEAAIDGDFSSISDGGNSYGVKGMVNIPIVPDRLAARLVAYSKTFGGFVDAVDVPVDYQKLGFFGPGMDGPAVDDPTWTAKDVNDGDTVGGRLFLRALLSEQTSLTAQFWYQDMDNGGTPHHRPDDSQNIITNVFFPGAGDLNEIYYVESFFDDKSRMANLTLEHDFDWGDLSVSASNFDREVFSRFDATTSFRNLVPAPAVPFSGFLSRDHAAEMDSVEIRLATQLDGSVNALVGAFYRDRTIDFENWLYLLSAPNVPDTSDRRFNRITSDDSKITALFGEVYYEPNDLWEFTLGARYFETDREAFGQLLVPFFGFPGNPDPPEFFSVDEDDIIFRLKAARQLSDDILGYVEVSEGFRAGGTNSAQVAGIPGFYDSDNTRNFEVGVKAEFLDQRVRVNASIYQIQWGDMQTSQCFGFDGMPDPACPFGAVVNVGGKVAESNGLEIDVLATPSDRWMLTSAISVADSSLTRDLGVGFDPLAVKGAEVVGTRGFTFAAAAQYDFPITSDWEGFVRADFQHLDGIDFFTWNAQNVPSDDYQNINFRAGAGNGTYDLILYAMNASDERGELNVDNSFGSAGKIVPTQPRTVGITIRAKF